MLPTQQTIQFSNYSDLYDLIVPHENILRRINDLVDFSFIQKELITKKYEPLSLRLKGSCLFP